MSIEWIVGVALVALLVILGLSYVLALREWHASEKKKTRQRLGERAYEQLNDPREKQRPGLLTRQSTNLKPTIGLTEQHPLDGLVKVSHDAGLVKVAQQASDALFWAWTLEPTDNIRIRRQWYL